MPLKHELALISNDSKILAHSKEIAGSFGYTAHTLERNYDFSKGEIEYRVILVGGADFPNGGELSVFIKLMRRGLPEAFILVVETKNSIENWAHISKTFGADLTMSESEFFETSKPDYILSQIIKATYLPIKSSDIVVGKPIPFDMYHLLPQREKFLKFCFKDDSIDQKKLEKIKSVDELYIHRNHSEAYATYINSSAGNSSDAMNRRCRSQFLALYVGYMRLVLSITDQSQQRSYQQGMDLFNNCRSLVDSLMGVLATHPDPWSIISNSTFGDFGSVERGPAVAAYSGIIGMKMGLKAVGEIMIACLVSELGLLFLPRKFTSYLRNDTVNLLSEEEKTLYNKYPTKSISVALDRKIQLSEQFRAVALGIHERADRTGFPNKRYGRHIPIESYVIHFAFELDRRLMVRLGKAKPDLNTTLQDFYAEEINNPSRFTIDFLTKLKAALVDKLGKLPNPSPTV